MSSPSDLTVNAADTSAFETNGAHTTNVSDALAGGSVKIVFASDVVSIPENFLKNQTNVVAVEFSDSLQSIGSSAFEGCTGLTSVTLPSGVISVGANAFKGCSALKSLDARALETKAGEPLHITTDKFAIVNNTINDVWVPNADDTVCSTDKNVGIGTTAPDTSAKLHVVGDVIATNTRLHYPSHSDYAGFAHKNHTGNENYCLIHAEDGTTFLNSSLNKHIHFRNNNVDTMTLTNTGSLGIGAVSPLAPLHIIGKYAQSDQNINIILQNRYLKTQMGLGMDDSNSNNDGDLYFLRKYPGASTWTRLGHLLDQNSNNAVMNFTGAHNCRFNTEENFETGMIVSTTGEYNNHVKASDGKYNSTNEILINEALPVVRLTKTRKDKSVFGVISHIEDGTEETRSNGVDGFRSITYIGDDGRRLLVNGVGEGGIWVVNTNGNLENGDYLQSSDVTGYSEKQDDDLMRNYTIGKITCSCNFDLNSNIYKCEDMGNGRFRAFVGCVYTCS
jgi:hypothetical protein